MRYINFPPEIYHFYPEKNSYKFQGFIGIFELLWAGIFKSTEASLSKKDHKVIRDLKRKLRVISIYKDDDKDARITQFGGDVALENQEYEMLIRLLSSFSAPAAVSEEITALWEIIDSAREETILSITKPNANSNSSV